MLFTINNKNYTDHIVADTYDINQKTEYEEYKDIKGIKHKTKIRDRIAGEFDMFFRSMQEYEEFCQDYEASLNTQNNTHHIELEPNNNTDAAGIFDCFVTFDAVRKIDGMFRDYMGVFTVTVEER